MSSAFSDPGIVSDLLRLCVAEGWIAPRIKEKVRVLVDHGLHPEQALLGTGLLNVDQYGEGLSRVSGLPFVRVAQSSSPSLPVWLNTSVCLQARAKVVEMGDGVLSVALADPTDAKARASLRQVAASLGVSIRWFVTLWSDVRPPSSRSAGTVASLRRRCMARLRETHASYAELVDGGVEWYFSHDQIGKAKPSWLSDYPSTSLSALSLHVKRHTFEGEWSVDSGRTAHGMSLRWNASSSSHLHPHPLRWAQSWSNLRLQGGIALVFGVSESFMKMLAEQEGWKWAHASDPWRESPHIPHIYRLDSLPEQEEACHAALSGRAVILLSPSVPSPSWLDHVRQLEVPISKVQRLSVPEGTAWAVFPYVSV